MTKALYQQKIQQPIDNTRTPPKFDYTTIANRLRTANWNISSHSTDVVKPVYGYTTFPITQRPRTQKNTQLENCK